MKAIVIGAGPAGLTAALELLRRGEGWEVTLLEESRAAGGISRTVEYRGNRMDIGGHRFFSKNERVTRWWKEILPLQGAPAMDDRIFGRTPVLAEGGPDPETEDRVMLTRHRVSRIYYGGKFFDYPVSFSPSTLRSLGFGTALQAGGSYVSARLHKLPETSLENFYINRFGRKLYSMFFEGYTEKLWGRHPRDISADWGAQRVKGLSVTELFRNVAGKLLPHRGNRQVETSLIESFLYPKYGPGQLWECVAQEIEHLGGRILYGARVERIMTDGNRVRGVIASGTRYYGDAVFSSMSLRDLVAGMRSVPEEIAAIAAGLPYRDFVTVGLLVSRLKLKNKTKLKTLGNIIPDCWIYVQDPGVKLGRIQIFNNWSPYMVRDARETVWLGLEYFCREGDELWQQSEEEWTELARGELVKMGILEKDAKILCSHRENVRKAYPAYFDTYKDIDRLIAWLSGISGLYCIGRNGQHRYNNMDHSMLTAFEAVDCLLGVSDDPGALWRVNTEKEYHETTKNTVPQRGEKNT